MRIVLTDLQQELAKWALGTTQVRFGGGTPQEHGCEDFVATLELSAHSVSSASPNPSRCCPGFAAYEHAFANARAQARTHARTHARSLARSLARSHARTHARTLDTMCHRSQVRTNSQSVKSSQSLTHDCCNPSLMTVATPHS